MNLKAMHEQRAALVQQMNDLIAAADTETRALSEEEASRFDELEKQVKALDATIEREERARSLRIPEPEAAAEPDAEREERAFADYVLGTVRENRAGEQNLNMGNNGAIIPVSIANRIIKTVKERCPILAGCTMYAVKGTLKVPVWGKANSTHDIAVGYQTEFTAITADAGKFTSVDLGGLSGGCPDPDRPQRGEQRRLQRDRLHREPDGRGDRFFSGEGAAGRHFRQGGRRTFHHHDPDRRCGRCHHRR